MKEDHSRLDAEWVTLNAFRGLSKIASRGDMLKSTYARALELGGALYPELLGPEVSLLRRDFVTETTKEYRQRAALYSASTGEKVEAITLVEKDLKEVEMLLRVSGKKRTQAAKRGKVDSFDQLRKKHAQLLKSYQELGLTSHTENQLIFRDAYVVDRDLPALTTGQGYKDFELPDNKILRVRVLHPDKPEHISGADIIYERHDPKAGEANIVAVQYKIWEKKKLYLGDERLKAQVGKLKAFLCDQGTCKCSSDALFRFPCCAAFLRPTDKLQNPNQKFISSGEHLPICHIEECSSTTDRGAQVLEYNNIKNISISGDLFEHLFNRGKIGSKPISYEALQKMYNQYLAISAKENVVIYVQEFENEALDDGGEDFEDIV